MTSRDAPLRFLTQLAATSAARWSAASHEAFRGDLSLTTEHSAYRFHHGMFVSRAKNPARFFDAPKAMRGLVLIGFLHEDHVADRWTLSTTWRPGSHAVLWRPGGQDATAFVITSPTTTYLLETPPPKPDPDPSPWLWRSAPASSGVMPRRTAAPPPSCRMPLPPSMTRLHAAARVMSER
jgi:hypothetical protein